MARSIARRNLQLAWAAPWSRLAAWWTVSGQQHPGHLARPMPLDGFVAIMVSESSMSSFSAVLRTHCAAENQWHPTSLPTLPPVRRKRRQRKMSRCDRELPQAVEPTGGHASQIMADALWIEQITAEEAAEACGRDTAWIQGIVDGTVDPTLDELELALNAIGLETRVSLGELSSGSLAHKYSKEALRERIRQQRELESEMYGRAWIRRTQPQPGVSTRMAGAGPGRSDGGGRSASLTRRALRDLGVTVNVFSVRAGIDPNQAEQLTRGKWKPATGEFERICASNGLRTTIWLDEYCDDDDDEHAAWEADPAKYEAEIDALRSEFQAFAADPQT